MVEESNFPAMKPAIIESLTTPKLQKRYNASLNRRQRTKQAAALRPKHEIHRKLKMPRVEGLLELLVMT